MSGLNVWLIPGLLGKSPLTEAKYNLAQIGCLAKQNILDDHMGLSYARWLMDRSDLRSGLVNNNKRGVINGLGCVGSLLVISMVLSAFSIKFIRPDSDGYMRTRFPRIWARRPAGRKFYWPLQFWNTICPEFSYRADLNLINIFSVYGHYALRNI